MITQLSTVWPRGLKIASARSVRCLILLISLAASSAYAQSSSPTASFYLLQEPGSSVPLESGSTVNWRTGYNIQAHYTSRVASVRFYLNGDPYQVDSSDPFLLFNDGGTFPNFGTVTIKVVPYIRRNATGRAGAPSSITLTVSSSNSVSPTATPVWTPTSMPVATTTPAPVATATPKPLATATPKPLATSTPVPEPSAAPSIGIGQPSSAPDRQRWESNMLQYGESYCNEAAILGYDTWEGSVWYYDGMRVYYQIADYTGDTSWYNCARYVRSVYRKYVLDNNGRVGGWRVFAEGLAEDYWRTGSSDSRKAAILLSTNSPFAAAGGGSSFELSRETAYLIHAYLTAEELGEARHPMLTLAVDYALGHLDQWTVSRTATYVQPFMVGLTFEALIRYYETHGDERIPPAIRTAADWLWNNMWSATKGYFVYSDHTSDLNLLIAPAYAWLYHRTGITTYRDRGDAIFSSGVTTAWLGNGKQYSQNYRWSFDYLKWRR